MSYTLLTPKYIKRNSYQQPQGFVWNGDDVERLVLDLQGLQEEGAVADQITITGLGTQASPFVAVGGGGSQDLASVLNNGFDADELPIINLDSITGAASVGTFVISSGALTNLTLSSSGILQISSPNQQMDINGFGIQLDGGNVGTSIVDIGLFVSPTGASGTTFSVSDFSVEIVNAKLSCEDIACTSISTDGISTWEFGAASAVVNASDTQILVTINGITYKLLAKS